MNDLFSERFFGIGFVVLFGTAAPMLLLALAIPYAILKMRDARTEANDPEIGLKSALYYGFSLGIVVSLIGLTFLVYEGLEKSSSSNRSSSKMSVLSNLATNTRIGLGLLASGIPTAVAHLILILGMTNDRRYPDARRIFVGWRLAIHSLVVLVAYTALMLVLFLKDRGDIDLSDIQLPLALLVIWLPSWLVHLILLRVYQRAVMPVLRLVPPTIRSRSSQEED
jgi:hypothetical protein